MVLVYSSSGRLIISVAISSRLTSAGPLIGGKGSAAQLSADPISSVAKQYQLCMTLRLLVVVTLASFRSVVVRVISFASV